jgi:hypothetical protein
VLLSLEPKLGDVKFTRICGGLDSAGPGVISGNHQTLLLQANLSPVFEDFGTLELTRP